MTVHLVRLSDYPVAINAAIEKIWLRMRVLKDYGTDMFYGSICKKIFLAFPQKIRPSQTARFVFIIVVTVYVM